MRPALARKQTAILVNNPNEQNNILMGIVAGLVSVLGAGGLTAIIKQWIADRRHARSLKAKQYKSEREVTQKTVNDLIDCETRCARLEVRVEFLEKENAELKAELADLKSRLFNLECRT